MRFHPTRFSLVLLAFVTLAFMPAGPTAAEEAASTLRIAAISGVHEPHQGFALSATVPSDRLCVELAQNLASELGIVVHVVCTDAAGGAQTIVAECGFAESPTASSVGSYTHGWGSGDDPYLICISPDPGRLRARRVTPDLDRLRPAPQRRSEAPPGR